MTTQIQLKAIQGGFSIFTQSEQGFDADNLTVPTEWTHGKDASWLKDFPIQAEVRDTQAAAKQLVLSKKGTSESVVVYQGEASILKQAEEQLRAAWMTANGMEPINAGSTQSVPAAPDTAAAPAKTSTLNSNKVRVLAVSVVAVSLLSAAGFFGAKYYLSAPKNSASVDLSSMSLDQLSEVSHDPQFTKSIQDQMLEAVNYGKTKAKEDQGKIPAEHLKLLESMGLDATQSMQSASACLSRM